MICSKCKQNNSKQLQLVLIIVAVKLDNFHMPDSKVGWCINQFIKLAGNNIYMVNLQSEKPISLAYCMF